MNDRFFGATDKGRVRQNNEDTFFVQPVMEGAYIAACVIDGVGGYEGGEVAAQIARDTLLQYLGVPSGPVATMMEEAMVSANDEIVVARHNNPNLADMACVATLVLADESTNVFHYVHVGDTRLYLLRGDNLIKVTKDQSFVGFLEDEGRITEREAMQHLKRNEIDKALGFDAQLRKQKDFFDKGSSPFLPGDMLLLCSDGLTDLVTASEITEVLQQKSTLKQKTATLIEAANNRGGKDNITVVLVRNSRKPQAQRAIKPKKDKAKKSFAADAPAPAGQPPIAKKTPVKEKAKGRQTRMFYLLFCGVVIAIGFFLWQRKTSEPSIDVSRILPAAQLQEQLTAAADSVVWAAALGALPLSIRDTLSIRQDSLIVLGNGLHLIADSAFRGAAIALDTTNRYLHLKDMVFENFEIAVLGMGHTVRLQNVRFLNCAVPVQYGTSTPVNTPADLLIKDSVFSSADTSRSK